MISQIEFMISRIKFMISRKLISDMYISRSAYVQIRDMYCRSGEEQSHKLPTPGDDPDEYRRAVSLFSFILRTHLAYDVSTNLELAS